MSDAVSPVPAVPPTVPDTKAQDAARGFEAVFVGQMVKLMFESAQRDDADGFSGGHAEEMFRSVLAETLGDTISKGRGIGIADSVMAEIIRIQQGEGR